MSNLIELFEFRTGDEYYRCTTRGDDRLYEGHVYVGTPLERDKIMQSPELTKNDLRLTFPLGHPFAMNYLGYGPDQSTMLTVRRNRLIDDEDFRVFWKGRVADCEATDSEISLICQSIFTTSKNSGLIMRSQRFCPHVVYNRGCNLDKDNFAVASSVTAIDARQLVVTCPEAAAFSDNYFAGGMFAMPNGALRYITKSAGDQITLWRPAPEVAALLAGEDPVATTLYPGCDGSLNTCNDEFDNLDNNGGRYWIPKVNPYGGGSVY